MRARSRITAMVMASSLFASSALAEPKSASSKDKQAASELVKKAIARSQAGDHSAAIEIYLQAYTIVPNSILLSNIGSEYQQSGKQEEALRYFCMYLEKDPTGTNAVYATAQARSLHSLLGHKRADDDDVCASEPEAQPKEPRKRKPSRDPGDPDDEPGAREPEPRIAEAPPPARGDATQRTVGLVLGGAGLVALGVSAYAGIQAKNISDEISSHPAGQPWENGIQSLQRRGQRYEYLQIGSLIGGGALVITGVVLYVRGRGSSDAHDQDRTAVRVAPTGNGLAVFGRF